MNASLSIILSVHNAQTTIVQRVEWLLDMLPDLAVPFEVLIVDDGSTDHTGDILHELAREFPQIQLAGHRQRQGRLAAVYTGLSMAKGDIVLVDDSQREMSSGELRALWKLHGKKNLVIARAANPQDLKPDVQYYRGDNPNITSGMQLFLRCAPENIRKNPFKTRKRDRLMACTRPPKPQVPAPV